MWWVSAAFAIKILVIVPYPEPAIHAANIVHASILYPLRAQLPP
jgi:hypothetical protein